MLRAGACAVRKRVSAAESPGLFSVPGFCVQGAKTFLKNCRLTLSWQIIFVSQILQYRKIMFRLCEEIEKIAVLTFILFELLCNYI